MLAMTPDVVTGWMNVAIEGEWLGHPAGPFSMDAEKMQQCVARFEQQQNPMVVDYEHNSVRPGGDGRAAGWIHELEVREGENGAELWAKVEWTNAAAEMIKAGEYRYCSPVIDFESKDRESNETVPVELFNVAITNNPFLDGMHPIALTRTAASAALENNMPEEESNDVEIEVKPKGEEDQSAAMADEPMVEDEGDTVAGALTAFVDAVAAASGGSKAAVLDALNTLSDDIGSLVRNRLEQTDGAASDAQEIPMSKTSDPTRETLKLLAKQQSVLLNKMNAAEAKRIADEKKAAEEAKGRLKLRNDARIEAMLNDGRLCEDERGTARKLLGSDPEMFEEVYGQRVAGSASPVGRRAQSAATNSAPASDGDVDIDRDLQKLSEPERRTYRALCNMGKDPKATLRRMLSAQVRDQVRMVGSRMGVDFPQ